MMEDHHKIKLITLLLLVILILTSTLTATCCPTKQKNTTYLNQKSKQFFVHINAQNHYDYGFKAGKKYFFIYKILNLLSNFMIKTQIEYNYTKLLENLSIYSPWVVEELQGLSNSTNIEIKKLLNIFNLFTINDGCTVILATGNATKNNETFLAQNIDIKITNIKSTFVRQIYRLLTNIFVVADIQTENYSYIFYGIPVFYEVPLMNGVGLGFGANGLFLTNNNTRYIDEGPGISTYNLERLTMMRCKNISEVQKLWKNSIRSSGRLRAWPHFWDDSTPSFCDKKGDILTIEQTHNYTCFVYRNSTEITKTYDDILWHTNHHQFLDPNLTGSIYPGEKNISPSSFLRAERAVALLEQNYGNITIDTLKEIMRDHEGGTDKNGRDSSDICCYPDKENPYATSLSWIINPQKTILYFAHNTPDKTRYQCIELIDVFN